MNTTNATPATASARRPASETPRLALWKGAALSALLGASTVCAQTYPAKPILLVSPYSGGGAGDAVMRIVTQRAGILLGQQFLIEPRSGAGGNIAAESVVKSAPDGYTLLWATPLLAINSTLYRKMPFDAIKNLTPVAIAVSGPYVMYVAGNVPAKTAAEFVALAKAQPGKFNYASLGVGTGPHLGGVLFSMLAGIELTHVPYKGFAQALPDLASGQVHMSFNGIGAADAFVQSGKIRILGFTSAKRLAAYPDVPAVAEAVPGFELGGWYGFSAPAGTPPAILDKLNTEFVKAVNTPEVAERMAKLGLFPESGNRSEAAQFFAREVEKWGRAVKASGARIEE